MVFLATVVILLVQRLWGQNYQRFFRLKAIGPIQSADNQVKALSKFDYTKEPPRPYRPFKSGLHVAMGMCYYRRFDEKIYNSRYFRYPKSPRKCLDPDGQRLS